MTCLGKWGVNDFDASRAAECTGMDFLAAGELCYLPREE